MLLEDSDRFFDLCIGEKDVGFGPDVGDESWPLEDVGWHHRLEFAVANKHHHGMKASGLQAEKIFDGLQVFVVLLQRILEPVPLSKDDLRPSSRSLTSEDPAGEVLRFDHKEAEPRHDDVVYLRRAVQCWQRQVVERTVFPPFEPPAYGGPNPQLAGVDAGSSHAQQNDDSYEPKNKPGKQGFREQCQTSLGMRTRTAA